MKNNVTAYYIGRDEGGGIGYMPEMDGLESGANWYIKQGYTFVDKPKRIKRNV